MTRRPGLSLVEVLAAIFIMGIGLISLFTLFPYGGLKYAEAFKDDRTTQSANAAEMFMRTYWKERVLETPPLPQPEPFVRPGGAGEDAMDWPNAYPQGPGGRVPVAFAKPPIPYPYPFNTPEPTPTLIQPGQAQDDPSYPLFVDPMGWAARPNRVDQFWVAEGTGGLTPRRNLGDIQQWGFGPNIPTMNRLALRVCSLTDGLTYAPDGRGADATGAPAEALLNPVQRELRYNWLWVLQRTNNSERSLARMTIVVFDKRADQFAPNTAEVVQARPTAAAVGNSTISWALGNEPPGLKKGQWLLDATTTSDFYMIPNPTGTGPPVRKYFSLVRNAHFYRVVSVTPNAGTGQVDVELHVPLRPDSKTRRYPSGDPRSVNPPGPVFVPDARPDERQFVVLAGVADVYEKSPLTNTPAKP